MKTTYGKAWRQIREQFERVSLDNSALDARLLGEYAFGFNGLDLPLKEHEIADEAQLVALKKYAKRRLNGEPVSRIIGVKEFYSLEFKLNEATLVPRPESELLVDLALEHIKDIGNPKILDLGVGSGCISIAILANNKSATAIGIDISAGALKMAQKNAKLNNVDARIKYRNGSWFEPIDKNESFDLIISNPPYIKSGEIIDLQKEVRLFDPALALDGGDDGLEPYEIIASNSKQYLSENGVVIVEFGQGQEKSVGQSFLQNDFDFISQYSDLADIVRVIVAKK